MVRSVAAGSEAGSMGAEPLDGWLFPDAGAYKFALYCEGSLVGATSLDVVHAS